MNRSIQILQRIHAVPPHFILEPRRIMRSRPDFRMGTVVHRAKNYSKCDVDVWVAAE